MRWTPPAASGYNPLGVLAVRRLWSWVRRIEPLIWNLVAYGIVAAVPATWALVTPFVPPGWSWPTAIGVFLGAIGLLLFVSNQFAEYRDRMRGERRAGATASPRDESGKTETYLRLQFSAGYGVPICLRMGNIWRWNAYDIVAHELNPERQVVIKKVGAFLFVVFDQPVNAKQIRIDPADGATLPIHEVKDYTTRHAVVSFSGDMSGRIIDFQVVL